MSPELSQLIEFRMQRAHEAMAEARLLFANGSTNTAANRLYYAAFYAVTALLLANNLSSAKHSGVRALFNQHFVNTGKIDARYKDLYTVLFNERTDADYADLKRVSREFVEQNLPEAEDFLQAIAAALTAAGYRLESKN